MSVTISLDERRINKALKLWKKLTQEERAKELQKSARSLAVRLANATAPYGLDADARAKGENAIIADIASITRPLSKYAFGEAERMRKYDPEAFKRRFTTKTGKVWLEEQDVPLDLSTIKQFHKSMRNKSTGSTTKAGLFDRTIGRHKAAHRGFIVKTQQQRYINQTKKKVGIAKAGWAECAAILGGFQSVKGVGSIQKWLQKLIANYGRGTVHLDNDSIQIRNSVPWIRRVLSNSAMRKSLDISRKALAKSVIAIVKHNSKKAGFA